MSVGTRADLYSGAVYGATASVLAWTLTFATPEASGAFFLFLCTCAALATLSGRERSTGARLDAGYPLALAALHLFGPGGSLAAAVVTSVAAKISRPRASARSLVRQAGLETSAAVLAAGAAAVAWIVCRAALPATTGVATGAHVATWLVVRTALARGALWSTARNAAAPPLWCVPLRHGPAYAAGALLAPPLAWAFASPATRPWLYAIALLVLAWAVERGRIARRRLELRHRLRSESFYESVTRALAKTMEAKDEQTQEHVRRVRALALEVGKSMGLGASDLRALEAASLLHDIGKLGVPEAILSKPGRLSEAEHRQIRLHPALGADILEAIGFPIPLAPIVRHHHERWDGTGYPDGLAGTDIPLGARILAVVDSWDALTSDRPYRLALSPGEAAEFLQDESGRAFDPLVVRALLDCVATGGFAAVPTRPIAIEPELAQAEAHRSLPRAELELQTIYEVARASARGLRLEEYMSFVACKLACVIPYRTLVAWVLDAENTALRPAFVIGHAESSLRHARLGVGERMSGWSALHHRAISGTRHVVPLDRDGSRSDLEGWVPDVELDALGATLAAPMMATDRCMGVLSLYDARERSFTDCDRRILVTIAAHAADAIRESGERAEAPALGLTDPLTGVPNARFLRLETASRMALHDGTEDPGFGLIAVRTRCLERVTEQVGHTAANRLLGQLARRLASTCRERETLARFGPDLFVVLTPLVRSGALVERWREIIAESIEQPLDVAPGLTHRVTLDGAHAMFPADGSTFDGLMDSIETRLRDGTTMAGSVIPFRRRAARLWA